ncbi:hypothetical protein DIPPA_13168 [Diplonema papillatum]|nr:hypothetical protein DIPPA_13168 [Diplonema papillatum]
MPRKRKAALPKTPAKKAKTAAPEDPPPKRGAGDAADRGALAEIAALMGLRRRAVRVVSELRASKKKVAGAACSAAALFPLTELAEGETFRRTYQE